MLGRYLAAVLAAGTIAATACNPTEPAGSSLSSADVAAIQSLNDSYVTGWLESDTLAILSTLADEAVLMPAGLSPLVGIAEIRDFWWPDDGSRTVITEYVMETDEVAGSYGIAYSRGSAQLSFRYEKDGQVTEQTNSTMYLTVYRKMEDGQWRIVRRMWGRRQ